MPSSTDRAAIKKMFREEADLARLVHQFNAYPAVYAQPEWFSGIVPEQLLARLRKTPRGVRRLSALLLKAHNLNEKTCYAFKHLGWRLALLPPAIIDKLVVYGGLALAHRRIATMVDRSALARLKAGVGEQAYLFAVKRAPLMVGRHQAAKISETDREDLVTYIRQIGAAYFLAPFADAPTAIAGRLAFKFSPVMAGAAINRTSDAAAWFLFKRILVHEIDIKWQRLFL